MTQSIYNIVKEPSGWFVFCDGVKDSGLTDQKKRPIECSLFGGLFCVCEWPNSASTL